jgi:hypothetical protein
VGNYSNGLIVSQTRQVAVIENLEDASFPFDRRIGGLAKIKELGVRRPAEFYYQKLDALRMLRQEVRRELVADCIKNRA